MWRAVALAVNYSLYNEVATEALFSPQVGGLPSPQPRARALVGA